MKKKLPHFIKNFKSGITISLISIPLSVSLSVASGVQPVVGIITAIWAGIVAALFGGSNYNIIGPTGALSGIIAAIALEHGPATISAVALMAGLFIFVASLLKLERFFIYIPSSVIHGFTLGIAFIIIKSQIKGAIGLTSKQDFMAYQFSPTIIIFFMSIAILSISRKLLPLIPGALIVTPLGILLGYCKYLGIITFPLATLGSTFGQLKAQIILFPNVFFQSALIIPALTVACIALLETMLSAKIADGMTATRHNQRKEMFGLALANITAGLVGGMPATAALARTAFNIKIGATSSLSALISSILVAFWSLLCLSYFTFLPMVVIAAILIFIAFNMIECEHFERFWIYDKANFAVALLVALATVYHDPMSGIFIGTALSLLLFVQKLAHGHFEILETTEHKKMAAISDETKAVLKAKNAIIYSIKGPLTYINSQAHISRFETRFSAYSSIILVLDEITFIDLDGIDALDDLIDICQERKQHLVLISTSMYLNNMLTKTSKHFKELENNGFVSGTISSALSNLEKL